MVKFLLHSRADAQKPGMQHKTPLFYARDAETTTLLLDANAKIDAVDDVGFTALHQAVSEQLMEVAQVLIDRGADVNAQDMQKQTPLHIAASTGQAEMCQLLLEHGADLKILDSSRRNPEMLARRGDHYNVLSVILSFHEEAEVEDTPLLAFRPFSGVVNSAKPPEGSPDDSELTQNIRLNLSEQ